MRIVVELSKLQGILGAGLICDERGKGLSDSMVGEFHERGLALGAISESRVGVHAIYLKNYFIEYHLDKPMNIPLTQTLFNKLRKFSPGNVLIERDEETLVFTGRNDACTEKLTDEKAEKFPFEMALTEAGFLPKRMVPKIQVKVDVNILRELPKADEYEFVSDGNNLTVRTGDQGDFIIPLGQIVVLENTSTVFDGKYLDHILPNLYGSDWLSIDDKALALSHKGKTFALTFLLPSKSI
jgi:hypothetical protein